MAVLRHQVRHFGRGGQQTGPGREARLFHNLPVAGGGEGKEGRFELREEQGVKTRLEGQHQGEGPEALPGNEIA